MTPRCGRSCRRCRRPSTDTRHTDSYLEHDARLRRLLHDPGRASAIPGPGGSLQREAFAATSHIITAARRRPDHAARPGAGRPGQRAPGGRASRSTHSAGPWTTSVATETAFGHRGALATVQYTATYTSGPATRATGYVRGFRAAMAPTWGSGAYVNYADSSLSHYLHGLLRRQRRPPRAGAGDVRPPPLLHPAAGLLSTRRPDDADQCAGHPFGCPTGGVMGSGRPTTSEGTTNDREGPWRSGRVRRTRWGRRSTAAAPTSPSSARSPSRSSCASSTTTRQPRPGSS